MPSSPQRRPVGFPFDQLFDPISLDTKPDGDRLANQAFHHQKDLKVQVGPDE